MGCILLTRKGRRNNEFSPIPCHFFHWIVKQLQLESLQVHWQRPQIHRLHHLFRVLGRVVESLYRFLLGMDVGKVKVDDADRTQLVDA